MVSQIQQAKDVLRAEIKQKWELLTYEEKELENSQLKAHVTALPAFSAGNILLTYFSIGNEAGTTEIISAALDTGISVYIPKTFRAGLMEFIKIEHLSGLGNTKFGTLEPAQGEQYIPDRNHKGLVLLPGLAFDPSLYRLGYGGGYYDRYLERLEHAESSLLLYGLAYRFQIVEAVPKEAHDRKLQGIITPDGII